MTRSTLAARTRVQAWACVATTVCAGPLTPTAHARNTTVPQGNSASQLSPPLSGGLQDRGLDRVLWRVPLETDSEYVLHRPTVGPDGTVFVNDLQGRLWAIAPSGAVRWVFATDAQGAQGPVAVGQDGTAYFASDPLGPTVDVYAVDPQGNLAWVMSNGDSQGVIAGPSLGPDGNLYFVTDVGGSGVVCVSPQGQRLWSQTGSPVISEFGQVGAEIVFGPSRPRGPLDRLYVAFDMNNTSSARLFSFDLQGTQQFSVETGGQTDVFLQLQAQPVVGPDGRVYLSSSRGGVGWVLEAFDPRDGSVQMVYREIPANGMSPATVGSDGTAYLVRSLARLVAVDGDGHELWEAFDGSIQYGPVLSPDGRTLLLGGAPTFGVPGFFRAYDTEGALLWQVDLPSEAGGSLVPDSRAGFSPDGRRAYFAVSNPAGSQGVERPYLYALSL